MNSIKISSVRPPGRSDRSARSAGSVGSAGTCAQALCLGGLISVACSAAHAASWRDPRYGASLGNESLEATLQAGRLVELKDTRSGRVLLQIDSKNLPATLGLLGGRDIDPDGITVDQQAGPDAVTTRLEAADGTRIVIEWAVEPGAGDLILRTRAESPRPESAVRYRFSGFDTTGHALVLVDGHGTGQVYPAPWNGSGHGSVPVALFEGEGQGWLLEGRGPDPGALTVSAHGKGTSADVTFARHFPIPGGTPGLGEIRIRTYRGDWPDAVDPHVEWMRDGAGYSPVGTGHHPAWVKDIKAQVYVRVGDFQRLEELAQRLDPARTIIGRQVAYRHYPIDHYWPDYTPTDTAKRWFGKARELGFHVGAHFNSKGIDYRYPELIKRFRRGLLEVGKDEHGNLRYEGTDTFAYCSAALKPFRDYVIGQLREAVEAGVDMIYWDQTGGGGGQPVVDGVNGNEGLILLMKETLEAYPGVAVETEQFNPMCTRYASFSLSQMGSGHPLGGYIFHHFIHILPESRMIAPIREIAMDSNQSFGHFLPSATEESWLRIARAFQTYDLAPDVRLPRRKFVRYVQDGFGGIDPVSGTELPPGGEKLFGYSGRAGVTAWFEKHPGRRGLVVYEPGQAPQWVGTRITGVSTWPGPGVLREWEDSVSSFYEPLVYEGDTILGLDPEKSYALDEDFVLPRNRFHLTSVPDDFARWEEPNWRIRAQDVGHDASYYRLIFTGHGPISIAVPDDRYDLYLDGEPVEVDRAAGAAEVQVDADPDDPATLLAVLRKDVELAGPCVQLPWEAPPLQRSWYFGRHVIEGYPADGPARELEPGDGFYIHVGGTGQIVGKLPDARGIRLRGAYGMRQISLKTRGRGIVRLNGKEVLNIDPGEPPYRIHAFDVDLTPFADHYVHLEFASEGEARDSVADWFAPIIVTQP